jgi:hypothetical protein
MLNASPYCRLDTIHFLGLVAKRMIASNLYVDQTFEATETQENRKAPT